MDGLPAFERFIRLSNFQHDFYLHRQAPGMELVSFACYGGPILTDEDRRAAEAEANRWWAAFGMQEP